ncbi:hypothetical protein DKT77_13300 [Meridianimarinicoccus roseus]|uniref:Uncharacterized protein n=1 Tax=Meridianimarinicoccus roseus TaxID=2072018 RepID=A0A2V2LG07_9RHOB|nr:glycosyltransferase family 9 protein [Meridianimarinicoccus roseus]PWR02127.1 hypothetical protein DKT77_13300 [Meridianimarinicoccus roseus]
MALRAYGRAQFDTARTLAEASLELGEERFEPWLLIAEAHLEAGREAAAVGALTRARAVAPKEPEVLARLTLVLSQMGHAEAAAEAARCWRAAVPGDKDAAVQEALNRARAGLPGAADAFAAILARDPSNNAAAYGAAMLHLGAGDFARGWPLFERRHCLDPHFVPLPLPRWRGESLVGRTLAVVPEGGHGDAIWSMRFLPRLAALGAEVRLLERSALTALFADLDGVTDQCAAVPEDTDFWVPSLSVPAILNLAAPEPQCARLSARPFEGLDQLIDRARGRKKVGLIWSGSVSYGGNRQRAAGLADFLPLLDVPDVQLYSLQKGPPQAELAEAGLGDLLIDCHDFDFAETAALLQRLDLMIMTDSAVAHLAGSLGRPVWLMLDRAPFWYFAGTGERSVWYPSMRLFRQDRPGDWSGPVARIRKELFVS